MSIIEVSAAPITHSYLMGKTKADLASDYMSLLVAWKGMKRRAETAEAALQKADALADLAYVHGAKAGWNVAHSDDPERRYREITEATQHAAMTELRGSPNRDTEVKL